MKYPLLSLIVLFLMAGCGYRPASHYTKVSLGKKIYSTVEIPVNSPEYAVVITDAVREAVVTRFHSEIASSQSEADSTIEIKKASHSISSIQSDEKGVTILYRATVTLITDVYGKNFPKKNFSVDGTYDFPADSDSTLSEQIKLDAVKEASRKALDELISKVAIRSI